MLQNAIFVANDRQCKLYDPHRKQMYLLICASNEDSNQHAHPRSLIRIFIVRRKKLCILCYPNTPKKDSDQNAQSDLNLRWVHMSEGTLSHATAHIFVRFTTENEIYGNSQKNQNKKKLSFPRHRISA